MNRMRFNRLDIYAVASTFLYVQGHWIAATILVLLAFFLTMGDD